MNRQTLADVIKPIPGLVEAMLIENEMLVGPCAFCGEPFNTHLQYTHCSQQCAELSDMAENGMNRRTLIKEVV